MADSVNEAWQEQVRKDARRFGIEVGRFAKIADAIAWDLPVLEDLLEHFDQVEPLTSKMVRQGPATGGVLSMPGSALDSLAQTAKEAGALKMLLADLDEMGDRPLQESAAEIAAMLRSKLR